MTGLPLVRVLGECAIELPDGSLATPTPIQRRLLARLAGSPGQPLPWEILAEAVWRGDAPRTAKVSILNQISRLRSAFEADLVVTTGEGYTLGVATDLDMVAEAVVHGELDVESGDWDAAIARLDLALDAWRGKPFVDLIDLLEVEPARRRAAELRHAAENVRLLALLRAGRTAAAVPEAERLVSHALYDEHRWALLAEALDLAGRRGDALAVFDRARRTLRDGLGLEPGAGLRAAEAAMRGIDPSSAAQAGRWVIGRDALLAELAMLIDDGGGFVLRGEAGIGVTALLTELARRHRHDRAVALTACSAAPAAPAAALAELLEQLGHGRRRVQGVVEQTLSVVRAAAAERPVLLIIDDVHLAGPSTVAVLRELVTIPGVAVVAAAPLHAEAPDETWREVTVGPLDATAVAELATQLTGEAHVAGSDSVRWLVEMSGGNPLFVTSLLDSAPLYAGVEDAESAGPPSTLAEVVRSRLALLGPTTRAALEVAAVAGPALPTEVLDELSPREGVESAFVAGLLVLVAPDRAASDRSSPERATFRHGVVRQVVEADLAPGRRAEIHHAIAELLVSRGGGSAAAVATHRLAAVELDPAAAVDAAQRAAREATRAGAHRDAADWFARAAAVAGEMDVAGQHDRVRSLIGQGDALRLAGDPRHEHVLADAAEHAFAIGDASLVAEAAFAALQLGFTTSSGRAHHLGHALTERALSVIQTSDDRARVSAAASLGYSMTGEVERCRELFLSAHGDARREDIRRQVLPFAYMALGTPDDLGLRAAIADELLALGTAADDPVTCFEARHLGFSVELQRADGAAARAHLAEMLAMVDAVGDVGRRWALLYQMAAIAHLDDDLERCEHLSEDAMALFAPVSATRAVAAHGGQLLGVRLAEGRLAELAPAFEMMVADQPEVPAWHAALALALVGVDDHRAAEHSRRALDDVPRDFLWLAAHVIGGRAAAAVGPVDMATAYVERLAPWSGRACWQGTCSYGPVDTVLALLHRRLGDDDAAAEHARRAASVADRLDAAVFTRELTELGLETSR